MPAAAEEAPRPTRRRALQAALAGGGLLLVGLLVCREGPGRLAAQLGAAGWSLPLVLLPYAIATGIDTLGWQIVFGTARPSLLALYGVRLAGEAFNTITPTAYLGGEPVKVWMLRRFGVPPAEGATSVILAKTALTIAQIGFVVIGASLFALHAGSGWVGALLVLAMLAGGAVVAALLVDWQRRGAVTPFARGALRLLPRTRVVQRMAGRAAEIDRQLRVFYEARPGAASASVALHLVGWLVGAAEVFVIMVLLGRPVDWTEAVMIEALAQPVRLAGLVIPGALGIQEAGGMVIFGLLALPPELGLAAMLLKRVREITYALLGLALLPRLRPPAPAAGRP